MDLPTQPVTLTVEQVKEIAEQMSVLRHDINGHLALIVAAAELIRLNPSSAERMLNTLLDQPPKIRERADVFSGHMNRLLGITGAK